MSDSPPAPPPPKKKISRETRLKILVGAAAVLLLAVAYYLYQRQFEDTDDAQIDGDITNLSPRVAGTVRSVSVVENQEVKVGQVLAELDPADYEVTLAQAKAAVALAQAQLQAEDPTVPITEASNESQLKTSFSDLASAQAALSAARKEVVQLTAQLAQAEAANRTAQLDQRRGEMLIREHAIAQADYDNRVDRAAAAQANVEALHQGVAAAKDRVLQSQARLAAAQSQLSALKLNAPRQLETKKASVLARQAQLEAAQAQLQQAQLNLGYTKITSPVHGIVGRKSVDPGEHVAPGQQLLAISLIDNLWVTANFRETQLERMHPGQRATIHVDALGIDLHGQVESMGGATGSRFSILPPENATGNYVKVVQRIPVRIRLDPGQPGMDRLRPGMSVEPKVHL